MMYEYAVDPALFDSSNNARILKNVFGRDKGRLIALFPESENKWKEIINSALSEMERKRISCLIDDMVKDRTLFRCDRPEYKDNLVWWKNAWNHDKKFREFKSILSSINISESSIEYVDKDIEDMECIKSVKTEEKVERTAKDMADIAKPLLILSKHIKFIDPYFNPEKERFYKPLNSFLSVASEPKEIRKTIEYHTLYDNRKDNYGKKLRPLDKDRFKDVCDNNIKRPLNQKVIFFRRENQPKGERMHARYILTDVAGLSFDYGLDTGKAGQTTDVKLLAGDVYDKAWEYYSDNRVFKIKEEIEL